MKTHGPQECDGRKCCIHNPSEHALTNAPLHWRSDRQLMERICAHGIGHPDPDGLAHIEATQGKESVEAAGIHGCDQCC
jgi:hypothetical protein